MTTTASPTTAPRSDVTRRVVPPVEEWSTALRPAQDRAARRREFLRRASDERRQRLVTAWLRSLDRS